MGILTKYLMDTGRPLECVELDSESVGFLHNLYPDLNVVEADFLKMDLDTVFPGRDMALIGNFPYNISSQIFFKVLDHRDRIPVAAGMLQKEVAERICAAPGNRDRGILSVLLQAWYDCEYLFSMRRKTLRNSLAPLLAAIPAAIAADTLAPIEPLLTERPERLSVDQFVLLTNLLIQK